MIQFGTSVTVIASFWTAFKGLLLRKAQPIQYVEDDTTYSIFFFDGSTMAYVCTIWKGIVPYAIVAGGYTQIQNDADKTDFETYYKSGANRRVTYISTVGYNDPNIITRFGNLTAASASEVLVASRAYVEQSAQAQRSVVSTSAQDASGGTGAKKVKITYLTSTYALKTEEVTLNGTTPVNTVATDLRFIETFEVSQGAAAVGAIKIMTATGGGGSEFCGISIGTYNAFLCHHYVPVGKLAWLLCWSASVDDESKFKLMGRAKPNGTDIVDQHYDLKNLMGIATPPGFLTFTSDLRGIPQAAESYIRVTVVPNQATSTVIRAQFCLWEESL